MSFNKASAFSSHDGPKNIGISPNLLKNFNLYEVLEPIKVPQTNEAPLIDLESPPPSKSQVSNSTDAGNSGFNLIDVYENIFVTPEHVSKKRETKLDYDQGIDYVDFIRKLEAGKNVNKTEESTCESVVKGNEYHQSDFDNTFDKLIHKNDSVTFKNILSKYNDVPDVVVEEDLIDEYLLEKSLAKIKISETRSQGIAQNVRILTPPILQNNTSHSWTQKDDLTRIQKIPKLDKMAPLIKEKPFKATTNTSEQYLHDLPKREQSQLPQTSIQREPEFSRTTKLDENMVLKFLESMECNHFKLKTPKERSGSNSTDMSNDSCATSSDSGVFLRSSPTPKINKTNLAHLQSIVKQSSTNNSPKITNTFALINMTNNDPEIMAAMPVQPILKDNKLFTKNRQVKNDIEKRNYTKGPDFNEKKIILPQMLNRLGSQKKILDAKNNVRKRLILDVGKRNRGVEFPVKLDPTILMEDCNRERLLDLKTRKMLDGFVKDGRIFN